MPQRANKVGQQLLAYLNRKRIAVNNNLFTELGYSLSYEKLSLKLDAKEGRAVGIVGIKSGIRTGK